MSDSSHADSLQILKDFLLEKTKKANSNFLEKALYQRF